MQKIILKLRLRFIFCIATCGYRERLKRFVPDLKLFVESDRNYADISTFKENALKGHFASKVLIFGSKIKDT
jgi:hypothetical protein